MSDSAYREQKARISYAFWAIIDANWDPHEYAALVAWCKAFEDIRR